ncbi:17263_t:CDS:2, partial [Gigaspora rosea]
PTLWSLVLGKFCSFTMLDGEDMIFEQVHTFFYQVLVKIEASSKKPEIIKKIKQLRRTKEENSRAGALSANLRLSGFNLGVHPSERGIANLRLSDF